MGAAGWIVNVLTGVGKTLVEGLREGWSGQQIRAKMGELVNDAELQQVRKAEKRVGDYLERFEE